MLHPASGPQSAVPADTSASPYRVTIQPGPGGADDLTVRLPCDRVLIRAVTEPDALDAEAVADGRAWGARVCARCLAAKGGRCPSLPHTQLQRGPLRLVD